MTDNNQNLSPILVNNQYTKDLSLEIPLAPQIFSEMKTSPKTDININVDAKHISDNNFAVELSVTMNADLEDKKLFILELTYGAFVTINVPEEHLEPVLLIEVPRLIFPFIRSIIANTLSDSGLPSFMLNPIDFVALYQAKKAAEQQKPATPAN